MEKQRLRKLSLLKKVQRGWGNSSSILTYKQISDHRFLFPASLLVFYLFPYIIMILRISYSHFIIPNVWMWGLVIFSICVYLVSTELGNEISHKPFISNYKILIRFITLCAIFFLLWHLISFYDLNLTLHIIFSLGGVLLIHFILTSSFNLRVSTLMILSSVFLLIIGFVVLGGIPLFNEDLRIAAKLSLIRETAITLFLIGATSVSLSVKSRKTFWRHIIPFILYLIGALMFALNGKRLDILVIVVVYGLYLIRNSPNRRGFPLIFSFLGLMLLIAIIIPSSTLRLVRQHFNFQVLRHIIFFVENPISGTTHGAISLGLKREFLGSILIYEDWGNWVLTATWLGPSYLDFGFTGILFTMMGLAFLLHSLQEIANRHDGQIKFEVLYIVLLGRVLVLFEEGVDLPVVIFLMAIVYVLTMENQFIGSDRVIKIAGNKRIKARNMAAMIILLLLGLTMIIWAFDAEFRQSQTHFQQDISTNQNEVIFNSTLLTRYYHFELLSSKIATFLDGELKILYFGTLIREFKINGVFWLANKDVVNIGWFKPSQNGFYTFVLSGNFGSEGKITIRIKDTPLSFLLPTYRFVQLGVLFIFFSIYPAFLTRLETKKFQKVPKPISDDNI